MTPSPQKHLRRLWFTQWLLLLFLCSHPLFAESVDVVEEQWERRLAKSLSSRLESIEQEVQRIESEQAKLPEISLESSGGTGGLATFAEGAETLAGEPERTIEVFWDEPERIDLVALIPARQFDEKGLILDYGLPDEFTVELIAEDGSATVLAHERDVRSSKVRMGYPFVYALETPIVALGLRVTVIRVARVDRMEREDEGRYLFAFSEVFCFSGKRNVALGAEVRTPHKSNLFIHWRWRNEFLVDGQTPLGLPELPASDHLEIGWLSDSRQSEDQAAWVTVDLGSRRTVDGIQLFPVRRPSLGNMPGFGLPQSFRISVSASGEPGSYQTVVDRSSHSLRNPGQNPLLIMFPPVEARFVKLEATKLWRAFENYPAFLALSEIQILEGMTNVAEGARVLVSDRRGRIPAHEELVWTEASLTDGYSSRGRLLELKAWFLGLDERLQLEQEKRALLAEAESILETVRHRLFGVALLFATGGLFFSIFVPLRYRIRRKREVGNIRRRIAGDLHDEVGSNLGCIQVYADLLQQQLPASQELSKIRRIAAETVNAVRDIVWLLRAKTGERVRIVDHLRESSQIMLDSLEWSFKVDETLSNYKIDDQNARNLILFYREALHNILRHADAHSVCVQIERIETDIKLSIADDGCGISPAQLTSSKNLQALKERAKRLNGAFTVISELGTGTTISLRMVA